MKNLKQDDLMWLAPLIGVVVMGITLVALFIWAVIVIAQ